MNITPKNTRKIIRTLSLIVVMLASTALVTTGVTLTKTQVIALHGLATMNLPPNQPKALNPYNNTINVTVNVTLAWIGGDPDPGDTVTYDILFGTTNPPPIIQKQLTSTSYPVGILNYGTQYYWRVFAWDNHNEEVSSPVFTFTTHPNQSPNTPQDPYPTNGSTDVDVNTTLSWTGGDPDSGDTVTYDVYLGTTTTPPKVATNITTNSWSPGALEHNTDYNWKIVAWDNHMTTTTSPLWNFQTSNRPPYTPSAPNPTDGTTDNPIVLTLNWIGGDPDSGDTTAYDVYFGTTTNPLEVLSNTSATTYDPGTLMHSTQYYWKIIAWDNHGASTTGSLWSFTTTAPPNQPPYVPSNPEPMDGATDMPITANLNWIGGDPDSGDTVTYDVYFGDTNSPPMVADNITTITYTPSTLPYNTLYYWRIVSWDDHDASSASPLWTFTTHLNQPPYNPGTPSPLNGSTNIGIDANLGWIGGDPDSNDTVTYDVYFSTTNTPGLVATNQSGLSYDPGTFAYSTTYYWQIIAWDAHGTFSAGPRWVFTTEAYTGGGGGGSEGQTYSQPTADANGPYTGEVGMPITFDGQGSHDNDEGQSSIVTYEWKFSPQDSWQTLSATPSFTYMQAGNFTVSLRVTDDEGQTATDTTYAVIASSTDFPSPPAFSGPSTGRIHTSYNFTVESVDSENALLRYSIDWGDGTIDNVGNQSSGVVVVLSHSWVTAHPFDITVTVSNGREAASTAKRILIDSIAVTSFGYLIDTNDDGVYDFFEDASGTQKEVTRNEQGWYLLDLDGNGAPDHLFNVNDGSLLVFESVNATEAQPSSLTLYILVGILVGIIAAAIGVILVVRKTKVKRKAKQKPIR